MTRNQFHYKHKEEFGMWVNWKRFSFGACLLASLSLLLFGCGDNGGSQTTQKSISGVVSDPVTGLALEDAKVTAYAIDAGGVQSGVPLSTPQSVQSDNKGRYRLFIPASYTGAVMVQATKPASAIARLAKLLSLSAANGVNIRSAVPASLVGRSAIPPVMVSFATNMVIQFMTANNAGVFSSDNIQKASIILETIFGDNFAQTPPPISATDSNTSTAQQDLIVSIQAINSFTLGSEAAVVAIVAALNLDGGIGDIADDIKAGIASTVTELAAQGILPIQYVPNADINTDISNAQFAKAPVPSLADTTPPAAPSGLSAGSITAKSVSLSWTLSPDADVAGYLVYRADSSGVYLPIGSTGPASAAYSDFSAAPGAGYSYQVVAFDASRNLSGASNTATATTPVAADILPPSAPAGLVCTGFDNTQVNLRWLQSTKTKIDGTVVPAAGYNIYRDAQFIGFTAETSYIDLGVSPSTNYTYYVKASDGDSNLSPASQPVTVHTSATPGVVAPAAPTGLALVPANQHYNNTPLTWVASATAATQTVTYNVYRDGIVIAEGINGTNYNDDSVSPSSSYLFTVTAVANAIESGQATPLTVATPANPDLTDGVAPTVPTNLSVLSVTSNSVALAWAASTKSSGDQVVAGYDVLRGDGAGNNYVKVATVVQPAFVDTNNVLESTSYSYAVQSFNSSGVRSEASLSTGVTTSAKIDLADTTKPNAPADLASPSASADAVALTWSAATKSNADATHFVAGYLVYRDGAQIADARTLLSFTDTTTAALTTYAYTVKAYDNSGNLSEASAALSVTTPAAVPDSYAISGKVTLNGAGISGVTVSIGAQPDVSTDVNGNYSFTGLPAGNYTVTPVPNSFIQFAPLQISITLSANQTGQDFAATLTGGVNSSVTYPDGTVIGGISFPAGTVIGGVTYPAGTIVGGVFYPSGTVIGGVVYPNGVVIGGVTYPAGTVVGGIAFPVGAVTSGTTYPDGTVISGTSFPSGTIIGSVTYPTGVVVSGALDWRYVVSGRVTNNVGVGLAGASVDAGGSYQTTTGFNGDYTLSLPAGTYTIGATLTGYSFADSAPVTVNATSMTGTANFASSI